jgi:hypothetical protein
MPMLNSQMHSAYRAIAPIATPNNFLSKSLLMLSLLSVADPIRDTLQARVDQLSHWVNWATAAVGAGVALEAIEPIHDLISWIKFRKRESAHIKELAEVVPVSRNKSTYITSHPVWLKWCGRVGIIMVVAGVVGEWRYGAKLEDAHDAVQKYDLAKLTAADEKAGKAEDSAIKAETAAQGAVDKSDAAKRTAGEALNLASGARTKIASLQNDLALAKDNLAALTQREADLDGRLSNLALGVGVRRVNGAKFFPALRKIRGVARILYSPAPAAEEFANELYAVLSLGGARWHVSPPPPRPLTADESVKWDIHMLISTGVWLVCEPTWNRPDRMTACHALSNALKVGIWGAKDTGENNVIPDATLDGDELIIVVREPTFIPSPNDFK